MSEVPGGAELLSSASAPPETAGAMLRRARQANGLHIAALATAIKVTPRKLELLEADRFDELPGPTFTRALAQTVCRTLKIDAAPVLALLPAVSSPGLEQMSRGLNEPFKDRPGRSAPGEGSPLAPLVWIVGVLAVVVALWYAVQAGWLPSQWSDVLPWPARKTMASESVVSEPLAPAKPSDAIASTTGAAVPDGAPSGTVVVEAPADASVMAPVVASGSAGVAQGSASAVATPVPVADRASSAPAAPLWLRARAASWVEVSDAEGRALLAKLMREGEIVSVEGVSPLRIKIGKASAIDVRYKGVPVDLAPQTVRDVARLELK